MKFLTLYTKDFREKGKRTMKGWRLVTARIVFFAIGFLLFGAFSYILRPVDPVFFREKFTGFYGEEKDSLNVISIGGSSVYRYINSPRLWENYGITSYNLSTPGQSIYVIENLMEEALKTQSPDLFIIETRKFVRTADGDAPENRLRLVTDNMKFSLNRLDLINNTVPDLKDRVSYYFDIINYHSNWEHISREAISYAGNETKAFMKGWSNVSAHQAIKKKDYSRLMETAPISQEAEKALISLLEYCRGKNLPVLFVAMPYEITKRHTRKNNYMAPIIESYGYTFLDCNNYYDEIGLDFSSDFYNTYHTNAKGALKCTDFIGNYITEHFNMKPVNQPKVKEEWEKASMLNTRQYEVVLERLMENIKNKEELTQK